MSFLLNYFALSALVSLLLFSNLSIAESLLRVEKLVDLIKQNNNLKRDESFQIYENTIEAKKFIQNILDDKTIHVPHELDWRKAGRVTKVKANWDSNSAMTGLLEGQMANLNLTMIDLSAQQLIDCLNNDRFMVNKLNELGKFGGIESELWYPYIHDPNYRCLYDKTKSVLSIKGGALLPANDEEKLKEFLAKYGPIAVGFDTTPGKFYFYHEGVFDIDECRKDLPVSYLLLVGYGTDEMFGDYWLVRNNYGTRWGEDGYMRVSRGKNICGIASFPTIAIL